MDQIIQGLDYDFNFQVHIFNTSCNKLSGKAKSLAIAWVNKLKTASSSVQEARLRNDFIYYLIKNCQAGKLKKPFDSKPPKGTLLNILNLLPPEPRVAEKKLVGRAVFDKSFEKGTFLLADPIPVCGAFCYLAAISKIKRN